MNFKSDNVVPVSGQIMQALMDSNETYEPSYGNDHYSKRLTQKFSEFFEKDVAVYLTSTGTAANSLALSALVHPYEAVFCASTAHIENDECNSPEFYTGGAKLITLDGKNGKIDPILLEESIKSCLGLRPHKSKPGCISITQASECGTVYSLEELGVLHDIAKKYKLPIHMDGARFANALVHLGCSACEATWKKGIDVMSFGATKNGAMAAEAIIFFEPSYAKDFDYRHKRAGQLMSKMRYFSVQFLAYLEKDLWRANAHYANTMAGNLLTIFKKHSIVSPFPVEANEVFVFLNATQIDHLKKHNCQFYEWDQTSGLCRFVTSFMTSLNDVNNLEKCLEIYA
jgi:threonine aldolase